MIMHGSCYITDDGEWIETVPPYDDDLTSVIALGPAECFDASEDENNLALHYPGFDFYPQFDFELPERPHRPPFMASEMDSLPRENPFDLNRSALGSLYRSQASEMYPRPQPPSLSSSRGVTPCPEEEEYRRAARRRSLSKIRNTIPTYTQALCAVSRRIRQQSVPTPDPSPRYQSRASCRAAAAQRWSGADKPPIPAASYYKNHVKSIYEREPMFKDFYNNIPVDNRNFYNRDSLNNLKTEFHDMIGGDQWSKSRGSSSSTQREAGSTKLYPFRNEALRDPVPASIRLEQIRSSRPRLDGPDHVPKLYVYHRSTWK